MRVAERLGFTDYSDVLAEVANEVTRTPPGPQPPARGAPQLAASSFPHPPATIRHGDEHAAPGRQPTATARRTLTDYSDPADEPSIVMKDVHQVVARQRRAGPYFRLKP